MVHHFHNYMDGQYVCLVLDQKSRKTLRFSYQTESRRSQKSPVRQGSLLVLEELSNREEFGRSGKQSSWKPQDRDRRLVYSSQRVIRQEAVATSARFYLHQRCKRCTQTCQRRKSLQIIKSTSQMSGKHY